jgi:hypothetical protein
LEASNTDHHRTVQGAKAPSCIERNTFVAHHPRYKVLTFFRSQGIQDGIVEKRKMQWQSHQKLDVVK